MGIQKHFIFVLSLSAGLFFETSSLKADDALVLPKGRFRARLISSYTTASNEYNATGEIQGLGASFSKKLNSKLLSAISPQTATAIKAFNAVSPGLGDQIAVDLTTKVDTEVFSNVICLEYGLTSKLSIGFLLPVVYGETKVDALTSPDEALNSRINALPQGHPLRAQLEAVQQGLNVSAFNAALTDRFNYDTGLEGWSGSGLGDLELGAKYNWFKNERAMATFKGGLRIPTGRTDNPDNLFDLAYGDGQWDLGIYHMIDYNLSANFGTTLELGYVAQLPDEANLRIPLSDELPLNSETTRVSRNLGDYWNAELEANYTIAKVLNLSARYRFRQKFSDSYSAEGQDASALESGTSEIMHGAHFQAEYSNVPLVRAGKSKIPYAVGVFYRIPLDGENTADSRTAGISLKSYF